MSETIETGRTVAGLWYARLGNYRLVAYARGGYARYWREGAKRAWCCFTPDASMPVDVERALCAALGVEMQGEQR